MKQRQVLVVGGTKGIGAAMAVQMASTGAHVCIMGRDEAEAARVLRLMRAVSPEDAAARHAFIHADLMTVAGAKAAVAEFQRSHARLDVLVFTVGILGNDMRQETKEGVEREFQCNFFARFVMLRALAPLLVATTALGPHRARVLNVASAGIEMGPVDLDDIQYSRRQPYSGIAQHKQTVVFNDLMVRQAALLYPAFDVNSFNPGLVPTKIRTNELIQGSLLTFLVEDVFIRALGWSADRLVTTTLLPYATAPELDGVSGLLVAPTGEAVVPDAARGLDTAARLWQQCEALQAAIEANQSRA